MISRFFSSPPRGLSLEDALKLAHEQLEGARKSDNSKKYQLCKEMKATLKYAEKIFVTKRVGQPTQDNGIATTYHDLAALLNALGYHTKAQKSHRKAEEWGYIHVASQETGFSQPCSMAGSILHSLRPSVALSATPIFISATPQDISNLAIAESIDQSRTQEPTPGFTNVKSEATVNTAVLPHKIFRQDVDPPFTKHDLPEDSRLITSTPQLAYCLSLSLPSLVPKEGLNATEHEWSQARVDDPDEQGRLQRMATDIIRAFLRDELKKPDVVAEVVSLSAVLGQDEFRGLLQAIVNDIDQSVLLKIHLLDGLAHLIRNVAPGYIDVDDLVKVLELLNVRLKGTHQPTQHIYRLMHTVSRVLDSMVDSHVKDLKREQLHEPLLSFLKELQSSSDIYLSYQAAYAYQALLHIPDDETILQSAMRRTGEIVQGISGIMNAVKALDIVGFIQGLQDIQGGMAGAGNAIVHVNGAYQHAVALSESGSVFLQSLKEGFNLHRDRVWYPALRGLDILIQEGRLDKFEKLVREAPCRHDPAFRWGVCHRLREIAANPMWELDTRQRAISFLVEMYKDNATCSQQANVKRLIVGILTQLQGSSDDSFNGHVQKQLQELGVSGSLLPTNAMEYLSSYPMVTVDTLQASPLLDRTLNKPDVEAALHRLRRDRLKVQSGGVYISPRAKASPKSKDDFDLTDKVQEFLDNDKKVLLLLGDSGAGKSTFNRALEVYLWDKYVKTDGRIPLFIYLPTIDKPEYDLIEKQLSNANFTEREIQELKLRRKFILICDGYDESQQTRNLYMSNQLNQTGGWQAQMVISCRIEYAGVDYKDCFQPTDRTNGRSLGLMREAIIMPFNKDQIQDYINQYVSTGKSPWESKDYAKALKEISNLQDLVRNPFLLKLALDVLPTLVDIGSGFSMTRITRIELYDEFVAQWVVRCRKRLGEMDLGDRDAEAFRRLLEFGFQRNGITYLKELAMAIYDNQGGNPVIKYTEYSDRGTWKEVFFSRTNGNSLLKEAIPLLRDGNQYQFIHKSVLEYGLTLAVYDPSSQEEITEPKSTPSSRRGSSSSILSFEATKPERETVAAIEQPLLKSPLGMRPLISELSILQFLADRAQQQPAFEDQLHAIIQLSKTDKSARIGAANAITILVQAGIQFNGADLRGIQIPGADLSYGVFDSAMLEGADLRKANLRSVWLRQANLDGAQMKGVQFGELPYLQEDSWVNVCAYSPNGNTFATGLLSGDINLYDTSSWSRIQTLEGNSIQISSFVFSPQGDQIASGSNDHTVQLWDVETGNCVHTLRGHSDEVLSVVYSPQGDQIASGSDDDTVRLWEVETGNCVQTLQGHSNGVTSVVYSLKDDRIASGSYDKTVRLWDVGTGNHVLTLQGHSGTILSVVYSPKGDWIASGSADETVRVWDVETGNCIHTLRGHSDIINSVVYSPQGDRIVSGSSDETVRLWDVETGDCIQTLQGHGSWVMSVAYSPQGDQIACGSSGCTVRLWDIDIVERLHTVQGHGDHVSNVVHSPKGDRIASGSDDKTIRLWDVETGNCVHTFHGHSSTVTSIVYSPKGDQIAFGSNDKTIRLWDVETGNFVHTLQGHGASVRSVAYSPKGDQIASGSHDKTVRLWDVETHDCIHTLQGHSKFVLSVAYSPNGDQIASGSEDNTARLWDVETGNCVHTLQGHSSWVMSVVYSPEGGQIATGSDDSTVQLWDVETGNCFHTFQGHSGYVMSVAYSPKGDQLVSGSSDKTVRLWNVETKECLLAIEGFDGGVTSISWEPNIDYQYIVTGSDDYSVRRWKIIKMGDGYKALLRWSSSHGVLTLPGMSYNDVQGLGAVNRMLLSQRGAHLAIL